MTMKEVQVKSYKRRTKSGKTIVVKAHSSKRKDGGRIMRDALYKRAEKQAAGAELYDSKQLIEIADNCISCINDGAGYCDEESFRQILPKMNKVSEQKVVNRMKRMCKAVKVDGVTYYAADKNMTAKKIRRDLSDNWGL